LGLRPSAVEVELRYKEEKLTYCAYMVDTAVFTSSGKPSELIAAASVGERTTDAGGDFNVGFRIHPSSFAAHADEVRFGGSLTPTATEREHNMAFAFDLSCLSSFRGCQALCEMTPVVWNEALRQQKNKEISLPEEELDNPRCTQNSTTTP
jgi:hypothetical protein